MKHTKRALTIAERYARGGAVSPRVPENKLIPRGWSPERAEELFRPDRLERELEQVIPDRPHRLPPGKRWRMRAADGGVVDPTRDMSPIDLMRLRAELPDHRTEAQRIVTGRRNRAAVLDLLLGGRSGTELVRDVLASPDLPTIGGAVVEAGLGAWGAPVGRAAGHAAKSGRDSVNVFVPAAEGSASDLARDMRMSGAPRRLITKATERFFGPEGRIKQVISDRGMNVKREFQKGDTVPARDVVDHPELFERFPDLADRPVTFNAGMLVDKWGKHGLGYTEADGGFRMTQNMSPAFYKEQLTKLMNYEVAKKSGFGAAVGHNDDAVKSQINAALRKAQDIIDSPRPGDDIGAAMAYRDKLMELNGTSLTNAQKFVSGNVDSRLVRQRANARTWKDESSMGANPYQVPPKFVGHNFERMQVLPQPDMQGKDFSRFLDDWQQYGVGREGFKSGGRVARALRTAKALTGAVRGPTPGRADKLPVDVPAGSYVIPADVVAALGEGNTEAGMVFLEKQFGRAPREPRAAGTVPILISDGEFVVSPAGVDLVGGNDALDALVTQTREAFVKKLSTIDGPNQ